LFDPSSSFDEARLIVKALDRSKLLAAAQLGVAHRAFTAMVSS
jgi:hypothetical protein